MARRQSPGHRRLALLRGRARAPGGRPRAAPARGRRPDRAERRGQDARSSTCSPASTSRPSGAVALDGGDSRAGARTGAGAHGLARTFQHSRSFGALTVRENVEVAALGAGARAAGRPAAGRRAARAPRPRGLRPPARGDARRTATSAGSASRGRWRPSRGSCCSTSRPPGCPRPEVPDFAAVVRSVRDELRGRRAADRPQHGADHGGLRPDPGARPGPDAGRGHARRRSAANLDVAAAYLGETRRPARRMR